MFNQVTSAVVSSYIESAATIVIKMPLPVAQVMEAISTIAREENIRVSVTQALRGGALAGGGAVVGALLGGPAGMAIGGTVGSILGATTSKDFKPLITVLKELPAHKQQELADKIQNVVASFNPQDALMLVALIQGSASVHQEVFGAVRDYFDKNLSGMTVEC
uniref:Protein C19orf12 homolog n=1 Tax=Phallusia mammillata TaxID=59560 RepID=A0A6F9D782_9ASCI|nr:protein C19orf12 homolog [Phallusia mammillata]